jgi:hypothetical protein
MDSSSFAGHHTAYTLLIPPDCLISNTRLLIYLITYQWYPKIDIFSIGDDRKTWLIRDHVRHESNLVAEIYELRVSFLNNRRSIVRHNLRTTAIYGSKTGEIRSHVKAGLKLLKVAVMWSSKDWDDQSAGLMSHT